MEIGDVPALVKWHMSTTVTPKERTQDSTIWWRQFPWHFYLGEGPSVRRGKHLQKGHEKPDQGEVKSDKCCSLLEMLLTDTWHCPVLITGRRGMRGRPWWRPERDNITKITNRQKSKITLEAELQVEFPWEKRVQQILLVPESRRKMVV